MKQVRLKNTSDTYFQEAWELYEEAFPIEERRSLENQKCILENEDYYFDVLIDGEEFVGFILWWNLSIYRYINHFATSKHIRNKGFGKLILNTFIDSGSKPILLEVELPTSTINERRIKFYERIGFKLNPHDYTVPSSEENQPPLQLLLMSYPNAIPAKEVEIFIKECHPILFEIK